MQVICNAPEGFSGAWSRDGVILIGSNSKGIRRVPAAGGEVTELLPLDETRQETRQIFPRFLPDGRHFFYKSHNSSPTDPPHGHRMAARSFSPRPETVTYVRSTIFGYCLSAETQSPIRCCSLSLLKTMGIFHPTGVSLPMCQTRADGRKFTSRASHPQAGNGRFRQAAVLSRTGGAMVRNSIILPPTEN